MVGIFTGKKWFLFFLYMGLSSTFCAAQQRHFENENLIISKISDNAYLHVSYLSTQSFGKVACNGVIYHANNQAIVIDTPADSAGTADLIQWVREVLKCEIIAVVPTHFHEDCLGGLPAFHEKGIPSHASNKTIELAKKNGATVPKVGFDEKVEMKLGETSVLHAFHGAGHTHDNIVSFFSSENILFGGCLIKSVGAGKGYLGDADTSSWSRTVAKIKEAYPGAIVIPGHGAYGGPELLDYTIELFKNY